MLSEYPVKQGHNVYMNYIELHVHGTARAEKRLPQGSTHSPPFVSCPQGCASPNISLHQGATAHHVYSATEVDETEHIRKADDLDQTTFFRL